MTEFSVGDIVYLKDNYVEIYKRYFLAGQTALASGQPHTVQIGLAKDMPLTIIRIRDGGFYATNFDDSWGKLQDERYGKERGFPWQGKEYKTWRLSRYEIEKKRKAKYHLSP